MGSNATGHLLDRLQPTPHRPLQPGVEEDACPVVRLVLPQRLEALLEQVRTAVAGVEDAPPMGWTASNISDGDSWDAGNERIKWGLFFEPSIPAIVTYDLTIPQAAAGHFCFDGIVSFDGDTVTIAGDLCVPVAIPAVGTWGTVILALLLLCMATCAARLRSARIGIV